MNKIQSLFLNKNRSHEGDFWLLLSVAGLSLFGLVMVYSASYYTSISEYGNPYHYLIRDAMWLTFGWIAFTVLAHIDYHCLIQFRLVWIALGVSFLLLAVLLILPSSSKFTVTLNGAKRWLSLGGFTIMPGEVVKSALVIFLAYFCSHSKDVMKKLRNFWFPVVVVVAAALLVFLQPNLSTAATIVVISGMIMIAAGLPWFWVLLLIALAGVGGAGIFAIKGAAYMMARLDNFWNPFLDSLGSGYQVCQGILALASGGVFGVGLGKSVQKALYLPEPMNDFILAIVGEELGFVGILCLLIVYLILVWRLISVAIRSSDRFGSLLSAGVAIHIGIQVVMNLAIVTASFPPTGVVLPLVSLGGSATVLLLAELGIAYNVSKQTRVLVEDVPDECCA